MATNEGTPVIDLLDADGFCDGFGDYDYEAQMEHEEQVIEDAIEHAFVICQRELNFCLNNDIVSRSVLAGDLLMTCSNWMADYTYATEGFGTEVSETESQIHAEELLSVFAPVYLRYLIASLFDSTRGIIEHIRPSVPSNATLMTEEQEQMMRESVQWFQSMQKPADADCMELGRLVARRFAALAESGDDGDELMRDIIRLDDEGLPVYAVVGLAATLGACVGREPRECDMCYQPDDAEALIYIGFDTISILPGNPLSSAFYAVLDGTSNRDVNSPSLASPAGIVDAFRYDMVEEGIRYFASLPFRRGKEWNDRHNRIIVPNKSDDFLLDHLLREGVLMPFSERVFQACVRKDSYETYEEARAAADRSERRGSPKLAVYRCPYCGKYHRTHVLHYDNRKDPEYVAELERRLAWHGIHSRELMLDMGRKFLAAHGDRIVRRIRERWARTYGGGQPASRMRKAA